MSKIEFQPGYHIRGVRDEVSGLYRMEVFLTRSVGPTKGNRVKIAPNPSVHSLPIYIVQGPEEDFREDYDKVCETLRGKRSDISFHITNGVVEP